MYGKLLNHQSKCFTVMVCFFDVLGQYADRLHIHIDILHAIYILVEQSFLINKAQNIDLKKKTKNVLTIYC